MLKSCKVSSVAGLVASAGGGDVKVSLVNVRDVVQYMPQIRYMMSKLTVSGGDATGDISHSHSSSKRQRVS